MSEESANESLGTGQPKQPTNLWKSLPVWLLGFGTLLTVVVLSFPQQVEDMFATHIAESSPPAKQTPRTEWLVPARELIESDLHAVERQPGQIEIYRSELLADLWPNQRPLPDDLPTTVVRNSSGTLRQDWPFQEVQHLAETYRITVQDDSACRDEPFINHSYYYRFREHPRRLNRLMIIHQGHGGIGANLTDDIASHLIVNGFDVLYCNMPLLAENTGPAPPEDTIPHNCDCGHQYMGGFETPNFNPLSMLFNHIPTAITKAVEINEQEFADLNMCGISGGGYTTTIYAALDHRIRHSFAVSSTMPHPLRRPGEWGWEDDPSQSIFAVCPLHVMYLLAAVGPNSAPRSHHQLYNFGDSVFPAKQGRISYYSESLSRSAARLGGKFDTFVDYQSNQHHITDSMQKRIFEILEVRKAL